MSGFLAYGDARKMHLIEIEGEPCILLAPNNGEIQLFRYGR